MVRQTQEETAVDRRSAPSVPREAEPRLPWLWLRPRVALRLLLGFLVLFGLGVLAAVFLTGATPAWTAADGLSEVTELGMTPQAGTLDADEVAIDARVAVWLSDRRPEGLLGLATALAHLGKIWVVVPIVVLVGGVVWRRTGRVTAFWVPALAVLGGFALSVVVKFVVFRPRPPQEVSAVEAFGPSFPSGHVIRAAAVFGAFAWLAAAMTTRPGRRAASWAVAGTLVVVVAAARVYEGAHWPTDVLASVVLGAGWLAVVLVASGLSARTTRRPPDRTGDPGYDPDMRGVEPG